jgi:hypothetical protein
MKEEFLEMVRELDCQARIKSLLSMELWNRVVRGGRLWEKLLLFITASSMGIPRCLQKRLRRELGKLELKSTSLTQTSGG